MKTPLDLRIALLAIGLLLVAAACGGSAAPPTTSTTTTFVVPTTEPPTTPSTAVIEPPYVDGTLTVWTDPALADAVRARGTVFSADTGIDVTVVPMPEADILPAVLAGTGDLPDVFIGPHTWLYQLAVAGLTEPVKLADGLPAGAIAAVSLRTFPLAVPVAVDAVVEMRNPTIVASAPTSVESIDCQGCLVFPGDGDLDITYPFLGPSGYLFGADPDNGYDVTDVGVDSDPAVATAVVLERLVAAGVLATVTDRAELIAAFGSGEAGIVWVGSDAIGVLSGQIVEPLPTIGEAPAVSAVRVLAAYVDARGDLKSQATRFAERYLGDADGSRAIADAAGTAPVWTEVATDAEAVVIAAAATGRPVPYAPGTEAAWYEVGAAFARILLGTPAETALLDAADAVRFADTTAPQG